MDPRPGEEKWTPCLRRGPRMKACGHPQVRVRGQATRLASSFAWRRSGRHPRGRRPDEHRRRDILTPGLDLAPAFPDVCPVAALRLGGLCPDTVALPSPVLTGFPHFRRCLRRCRGSRRGGSKERRRKAIQRVDTASTFSGNLLRIDPAADVGVMMRSGGQAPGGRADPRTAGQGRGRAGASEPPGPA